MKAWESLHVDSIAISDATVNISAVQPSVPESTTR